VPCLPEIAKRLFRSGAPELSLAGIGQSSSSSRKWIVITAAPMAALPR
jgi:hypothetical protein